MCSRIEALYRTRAINKPVGAQFMPGLLDANLCKNKQTNNNITMLLYLYGITWILAYIRCCFCLFLHKLTSNKPGIYWAVTNKPMAGRILPLPHGMRAGDKILLAPPSVYVQTHPTGFKSSQICKIFIPSFVYGSSYPSCALWQF